MSRSVFVFNPIFIILLIIAVVALLTFLLKNKSGRWIASILVVGLLFFSFLFFAKRSVFIQQHVTTVPIAQVKSKPVPSLSPIWSQGIEQQFLADVYPSQAAADRAMEQHGIPTQSAKIVDKAWVENFSDFMNQDQNSWRLARSQSSCTSANEAQQEALAHACNLATSVLHQWFQQRKFPLAILSVNPIDLEEAGIIADRFVQSFEGAAGRIWRQTLLLDFSPEKLNRLAQKHLSITTAARQSWFRSILTLAGLLALICLIYFFLNMATRGYYTWAIRIAMGVLLAIGVGMILLIA